MSDDAPRPRPWIVVVGGFLGSGKTSLILAAARLLEQRGVRCAVILNDQSDDLVDAHHAEAQGFHAREVTGGCFCCRFSELISVIEHLQTFRPAIEYEIARRGVARKRIPQLLDYPRTRRMSGHVEM